MLKLFVFGLLFITGITFCTFNKCNEKLLNYNKVNTDTSTMNEFINLWNKHKKCMLNLQKNSQNMKHNCRLHKLRSKEDLTNFHEKNDNDDHLNNIKNTESPLNHKLNFYKDKHSIKDDLRNEKIHDTTNLRQINRIPMVYLESEHKDIPSNEINQRDERIEKYMDSSYYLQRDKIQKDFEHGQHAGRPFIITETINANNRNKYINYLRNLLQKTSESDNNENSPLSRTHSLTTNPQSDNISYNQKLPIVIDSSNIERDYKKNNLSSTADINNVHAKNELTNDSAIQQHTTLLLTNSEQNQNTVRPLAQDDINNINVWDTNIQNSEIFNPVTISPHLEENNFQDRNLSNKDSIKFNAWKEFISYLQTINNSKTYTNSEKLDIIKSKAWNEFINYLLSLKRTAEDDEEDGIIDATSSKEKEEELSETMWKERNNTQVLMNEEESLRNGIMNFSKLSMITDNENEHKDYLGKILKTGTISSDFGHNDEKESSTDPHKLQNHTNNHHVKKLQNSTILIRLEQNHYDNYLKKGIKSVNKTNEELIGGIKNANEEPKHDKKKYYIFLENGSNKIILNRNIRNYNYSI